jgi:pilus assembly protein CpaF
MSADPRYPPWQPWPGHPAPVPASIPPAAVREHVNGNGGQSDAAPLPPPLPQERRPGPTTVDDTVVRVLRDQAAGMLTAELRGQPDLSLDDRSALGADITARVVRAHVDGRRSAGEHVDDAYEQSMMDAVLAYLFGLGRLQAITDDPAVENVMVYGHDHVRVEYADGRIEEGPLAANDDGELVAALKRIAAIGGQTERALSAARPTLNMRLPNGNRLAALTVVTPKPVVVARRHRTMKVDLDDMVTLGGVDVLLRHFLAALVRANLNVIISGPPNSGKTTLMRAMATEIPHGEWFATMETEYELGLHETGEFPWVVPIEAREGHGDLGPDGRPIGEVSLERVFPDMLRLSMTRVLVGEVRSAEITPMFDAMNTMRGSMCTVHARHADGVLNRLAELLMRYGCADTLTGAWLTIVNTLDYIVYVEMVNETAIGGRRHRFVSHVIEILGVGDGTRPSTQTIFGPGADGRAIPRFHPERTRDDLTRAGFDLRWLNNKAGMWQQPLALISRGGGS